jgi:hypothetical protein
LGCTSVGRVLALYAQDAEFNLQHHQKDKNLNLERRIMKKRKKPQYFVSLSHKIKKQKK